MLVNKKYNDLKLVTGEDKVEELKCDICTDFYIEPFRLTCLHVLCRRCLIKTKHSYLNDDEGINNHKSVFPCPFCKSGYCVDANISHYARFADDIVKKIEELMFKCPSCPFKNNLGTVNLHLNESCSRYKMLCVQGCLEKVCPKNMKVHCSETCIYRKRECKRNPKCSFQEKDTETHHLICPYEPVTCENINLDDKPCGYLCIRKKVAEHNKNCWYRKVECKYCQEIFHSKVLGEHKLVCAKRPIECKLCNQEISLDFKDSHLENFCPETNTECSECGLMDILRKDFYKHNLECPEVDVKCKYYEYGCSGQFKRKKMEKHETKDVNLHLELMKTANQMKSQFPINFVIGMELNVLDLQGDCNRWRKARILEVNYNYGMVVPPYVKVHYVGWDGSHDEEILMYEWDRFCTSDKVMEMAGFNTDR